MSQVSEATVVRRERTLLERGLVRLFWGVSMLAAVAACAFGYLSIDAAESAPQQAAGAAMALLIAIGPYIFARSLDELLR